MTETQLAIRVKKWQSILRLRDWTIKVRFSTIREMDDGDCQAQVEYSVPQKQAIIRVLEPDDYDPTSIVPQDIEVSIVHELLHLHFHYVDKNGNAYGHHDYEEQAIAAISNALVTLDRKKK